MIHRCTWYVILEYITTIISWFSSCVGYLPLLIIDPIGKSLPSSSVKGVLRVSFPCMHRANQYLVPISFPFGEIITYMREKKMQYMVKWKYAGV